MPALPRHPRTGRLARGSFTALLLSLAACENGTEPNGASDSPGEMAFASTHEGDAEIYLMKEDGSRVQNLTRDARSDEGPVWSPDGSKILFRSERFGPSFLFVMDADGGNWRQLPGTVISRDDKYGWSPDGTKVIFESGQRIYVIDQDGSNLRTLPVGFHAPAWSPDGTRIAVTTARYDGLVLINADGSQPTHLVSFEGSAGGRDLAWSPDGRALAFVRSEGRIPSIWVVNVDGTGLRRLPATPDTVGRISPAWSPDGQKLAYIQLGWVSSGAFTGAGRLSIVNADGSPYPLVLKGPYVAPDELDGDPSWSPDGKKIVFTRGGVTSAKKAICVATLGSPSGETCPASYPGYIIRPFWRPK